MTTVEEIFKHFGSQAELARKLECKSQNLTHWKNRGVPASAAIKIEKLSNGEIKAVDIPLQPETKKAA